jgi:ferritin
MKKPILTKKTSLSDDMCDLLNKQIAMESQASHQYLACASWCHREGYEGASAFMYRHSDEERMHMLKLVNYVNDAGGHALAPEVKQPVNEFKSLRELFDFTLEHELKVSRAINNIVDACFKEKDFASFQFMQWYVQEQREEEQICRRILELFDIIGEEGQGLWLIDREIAKFNDAVSAEGAGAGEAGGEA